MKNSHTDSLKKQILEGIQQLNLQITAENLQKLFEFVHLLEKWNKVYNLTAIRDPSTIVTKHILDSLSIFPYLKKDRILDVGTGPGFPGLPLALIAPEWRFVLLDSNGKKTRFLSHVVSKLAIANVKVEQNRVENYLSKEGFDSIVLRAVSSIDNILKWTQHLLSAKGRILIMKGVYPASELEKISQRVKVYPLFVPGLKEQRHLVCVEGIDSE